MRRTVVAVVWALASALVGCSQTETDRCGSLICPPGKTCQREVNRCVGQIELAACVDRSDGDPCATPGGTGLCDLGSCVVARCGNSIVEKGEACDDGNLNSTDGCSFDCRSRETCGNQYVDYVLGEVCDDGNSQDDDGCRSDCQVPVCGDGVIDTAEVCDDGNRVPGDGCSFDCSSAEICGNGIADFYSGEQCDELNSLSGDGCDTGCALESPRWSRNRNNPLNQSGFAFYVPELRHIVWMGVSDTAELATWLWDGRRLERTRAIGSAPPARSGMSIAYDAGRKRAVMIGGTAPFNVWEWDGRRWYELHPSSPIEARAGAAMAYDHARSQMVIFGGQQLALPTVFNDTHTWDGAILQPAGGFSRPEARYDAQMAYDAKNRRVVLFGGNGVGDTFNDTWAWDGTGWTEVSTIDRPSNPSNRSRMSYDAQREALVLVEPNAPGSENTWVLSSTGWQRLSHNTPVFQLSALAHDPARGRTVAFGANPDSEIWEHSATAWELMGTGRPFEFRDQPAGVYDRNAGSVFVFGGLDPTAQATDEAWQKTGEIWRPAKSGPRPEPRSNHRLTYDRAQRRIILFGGQGASGSFADTWQWDGATWSQLAMIGLAPPKRSGHVLVYDEARNNTMLFGGVDEFAPVDDSTWIYDGSWLELQTETAPTPRFNAVAAYFPPRQSVIMFGGDTLLSGGPGFDNPETWEWNGSSWVSLSHLAQPPKMQSPALTYDAARRRLILSGQVQGSFGWQLELWDFDGAGWQRLPDTSGVPELDQRAAFSIYDAALRKLQLLGLEILQPEPAFGVWSFGFQSSHAGADVCLALLDLDEDGRRGCADDDCWAFCRPFCPPGEPCDTTQPRCGDGQCNAALENCMLCPEDCGNCPAICGDLQCASPETSVTCAADCL